MDVNRQICLFSIFNILKGGERKIEDYLTYLARDCNVAPSTQNQALNALVFLYKHVLKYSLNDKINAERASKKMKIPVVLTRDETKRILQAMTGPQQIVVKFLYGSDLHAVLLPFRASSPITDWRFSCAQQR